MNAAIRPASGQDVEVLSNLISRSFRNVAERFGLTPANCPRHPSNCTPAWIAYDLAAGKQYLLLEIAQAPAGCVAIKRSDARTGKIERLAVLPEHRLAGCGRLLLDRALQTLRDMGLARAELAIIADHTDLRDWYVRRGFLPTGTKRFDHLPFAVSFMQRDL
jgi:GNAT superfamily N-acetyltransferase